MTNASTTRIIGWPRLAGVWLTLTVEILTKAFWRPLAILLAAVGVFLLGVMDSLPYWLHWGVLVVLAVVLLLGIGQGVRQLRAVRRVDLLRRLEQVNNLAHRPLRSLEDDLNHMGRDGQAAELWYLHQQRLRRSLGRLKLGPPRAILAHEDPYALRFVAVALFIIGMVTAGPDWSNRLVAGISPATAPHGAVAQVTVDAWVSPPEYTRMAPIVLDSAGRKTAVAQRTEDSTQDEAQLSDLARRQQSRIAAPVGSRIAIRVNHTDEQPVLLSPDGTEQPMTEDTAGYFGLETILTETGAHKVLVDGAEIATWDFALIPDNKPEVSFKGDPTESQRHSLLVPYLAQDDYGVEKLSLHIRLAGADGLGKGKEDAFSIPVAARQRSKLDSSYFIDLTPHPWAGLRVVAWLQAEDAIGQMAQSKPIAIVLPQRIFTHPVARAIIRERQKLAAQGAAARFEVIRNLHNIAWNREAYDSNPLIFMALSVAKGRLQYRTVDPELPSVMKILWDTALRLEDGEVSLAAQELQAIQQKLMEAMARGASQQELDALMRQMEQAMAEYLKALEEQAQKQPGQGKNAQERQLSQMMSGQSLQDMMQKIRDLMRMGMMEEAQQMLSQLQQMMQNLQVVEQQMPRDGEEALKMLRDLQNMMGEQQDMMERTHERAMGREGQRQSSGGENADGKSGEMADSMSQDELRQRLKELSQRYGDMMGDVPGSFGDADQSMQDAAQALAQGRNHRAVQNQGSALDSMQQASRAMQQAIIEKFMGQGAMQQPVQGVSSGDGRDPFGHVPNPGSRGSGRGDQKVPTQSDVDRARQIQDELRRRSGEPERPPVELDYIDRLLNPF